MALIRPDVLVLAAGGVVGEAWMTGVLRGLTESTGIDFRGCDYFVCTSAGSIVAASLAAGREPRAPTGRSGHQEAPQGRGRLGSMPGAVGRRKGMLTTTFTSPKTVPSSPGSAQDSLRAFT